MRDAGRVVVLDDAEALARRGASEFAARAAQSVEARGRFAVALSGGSTPRRLNRILAEDPYRREVPWKSVHLFWGDERHVPPSDPQSNYRMVRETLLSRVDIPASNVHRIEAERDPDEAAMLYEEKLRRSFALVDAGPPRFDLVFLGMGADGHTASLFPGTDVLEVRDRWVAAPWVPQLLAYRITMTVPVFEAAAAVLFLVSGAEKAQTLLAVLDPSTPPEAFPCLRVRPRQGELIYLVDRAAAGSLDRPGK
jgi:6-phosphogluconolactonase